MKKYLLIFLLIACLVVPASSQVTHITAPTGQAIWAVDLTVQPGTTGTFSATQSNGDSVSGSFSYTGFPMGTTSVNLDGDTSSGTFVISGGVWPLYMSLWNGDNSTYGRELKLGYGQVNGAWNDVVKTDIARYPITDFYLNADQTVVLDPEYINYSTAAVNLNYTPDFNLVELLTAYSSMIVVIFLSLIYWLKFLFIDHLMLVVTLYITGTAAYAANTSRDIFRFYKTWFRQQVAFFNFMAQAFATTFQIVTQVAVVIGTAMGTLASFVGNLILTLFRI